ncbi:hypothetical protein DAETH_44010 (plasmid) [Deinococcus aetherius]|uniref:Uncharacterized protein n=1 Tax=Deinococcus aetherius TaxID=200252 RepID=A0ABN6RM97_9DEIO|nr:hypothetical protein DAETH_44010 [Deinococcus aetherius]
MPSTLVPPQRQDPGGLAEHEEQEQGVADPDTAERHQLHAEQMLRAQVHQSPGDAAPALHRREADDGDQDVQGAEPGEQGTLSIRAQVRTNRAAIRAPLPPKRSEGSL